MPSGMDREWTLAELAAESGVAARTIRYYIARGLLEGPVHAGRGAVYTARHVERLSEIRRMQETGLTLAEIGAGLSDGSQTKALPEPERWWQYRLGDDVVILLRAGMSPWRVKQIKGLLERLAGPGNRKRNPGNGA